MNKEPELAKNFQFGITAFVSKKSGATAELSTVGGVVSYDVKWCVYTTLPLTDQYYGTAYDKECLETFLIKAGELSRQSKKKSPFRQIRNIYSCKNH